MFAQGKKASCPGAKLFVLANGQAGNRAAFTLVRKYGTAVERNYARRLTREAFRLMKTRIKPGFDCVLLVYPGGDQLENRTRQLSSLFAKTGLLVQRSAAPC